DFYKYPVLKDMAAYISSKDSMVSKKRLQEAEKEIETFKEKILTNEEYSRNIPSDIEDFYPMSYIETGMFYYIFRNPGEAVYHDQVGFGVKIGDFDRHLFEKTWNLIMHKHPILRTSFDIYNFPQPVQFVHKSMEIDSEYYDIRNLGIKEQDDYIESVMAEDRKNTFDLFSNRLWRLRTFITSDEDIYIMLVFHHAILDGWSLATMMSEMVTLYFESKEKDVTVCKLKSSYKDFIIHLASFQKTKEDEEYWRNELEDYKRLDFLKNASVVKKDSITFGSFSKDLDIALVPEFRNVIKNSKINISDLFFAAYSYMLNMISYRSDFVVGYVDHNRPVCEDSEKILGCFLNTVPVRIDVQKDMTWREYLQYINNKVVKVKSHSHITLTEIKSIINENTSQENPFFDTIFAHIDFHVYEDIENMQNNNQLITPNYADSYLKSNTLFDFMVSTTLNEFKVIVKFSEEFFSTERVSKMVEYFFRVLKEIIYNPNGKISRERILHGIEIKKLVNEFNDTGAPYPGDKSLCELFEEQVERTPESIALVSGKSSYTYRELNIRANRLAKVLQSNGVGNESVVGVLAGRSNEMIIGMLGILKAGGAYLPIDPGYPKERILYMLKDSNARTLLLDKGYKESLAYDGLVVEFGVCENEEIDGQNLKSAIKADNLAYIMYTSGSTGKPKGVEIIHRNVVRLVKNANYIEINKDDRILQTGAPVFDATTFEVWGALLNGARLYLVNEDVIINALKLRACLLEYNITILWLTSPLFNQLSDISPDMFNTLNFLIVGGDVLSARHINNVRKCNPSLTVINGYGPTENTTFSVCHLIDRDYEKNIPIGKPVSNSRAYIVDDQNNLQPIGVEGELCVAGDGLARGYLNQPELTKEKFVENPFESGSLMYRTGDLARWLPDGTIEFLGRIDNQVKIRGYRIEIGEIESQLSQHPDIKECVVVTDIDKEGNKNLVAYYVSDKSMDLSELRHFIQRDLPDYMVPSYFIQIDAMPLNQNGKINRTALPKAGFGADTGVTYAAPLTKVEKKLAEIWKEVLNVERIGVHDNFFDLGGHSLKAATMVFRVHKELNVELPIAELFRNNSLKELSQYIERSASTQFVPIGAVGPREYYPVSSAQKRLYLLNEMDKEGINYNIPVGTYIEGGLDCERFKRVLQELVNRHEPFRTSFHIKGDEPVQRIDKEAVLDIEYIEATEDELDVIAKNFIRPFNLGAAPLMRVCLVRIDELKHVFLIDIHHIISDGTSLGLIFDEIARLYNGESLEPLRLQYKDYVIWQQENSKSEKMAGQKAYWEEVFDGEIPVLEMATDYPRPPVQTFDGAQEKYTIDSETLEKLRNLALKNGATLFMVLLSAYNILLSKYSGQEDIVVGSPVAGRSHAELENITGMFVNTLALRNRPSKDKTFIEFLSEVRDSTMEAFDNQDYQFEDLVDKVVIKRDLSRNPIFDTMFTLQNIDIGEMKLEGLNIKPYELEYKMAIFDISLIAIEEEGKLKLCLDYCTNLYRKDTAKRMLKHYATLLEEIVESQEALIGDLNILPEEEQIRLIKDFNNTYKKYPVDKTIMQLFEEQAARYPDNTALVHKDKTLSYRQLNEMSNR
ncbi:MAG: amino acid adenylation domain-containing protein, partial [Clostridiaceae bacterium]|nr:amino acid adenylation domain-containing protein [Clostridiaceae bacterium]